MVVAAKLLQPIRHYHAAAVRFVAEVRELMSLGAVGEAQRKERIGLDRQPLSLIFLPEELTAAL